MTKRRSINLRKPATAVHAVLCRDDDGEVAVWLGKKKHLELINGCWDSTCESFNWLIIEDAAEMTCHGFCTWFDVEEEDLPRPGEVMRVTIELPKWMAGQYE